MPEHYTATGACAGCPYQAHCHAPRQHAMDPAGLGRHTTCVYYVEFTRRQIPRPVVRRPFWARLLQGIIDRVERRRRAVG